MLNKQHRHNLVFKEKMLMCKGLALAIRFFFSCLHHMQKIGQTCTKTKWRKLVVYSHCILLPVLKHQHLGKPSLMSHSLDHDSNTSTSFTSPNLRKGLGSSLPACQPAVLCRWLTFCQSKLIPAPRHFVQIFFVMPLNALGWVSQESLLRNYYLYPS